LSDGFSGNTYCTAQLPPPRIGDGIAQKGFQSFSEFSEGHAKVIGDRLRCYTQGIRCLSVRQTVLPDEHEHLASPLGKLGDCGRDRCVEFFAVDIVGRSGNLERSWRICCGTFAYIVLPVFIHAQIASYPEQQPEHRTFEPPGFAPLPEPDENLLSDILRGIPITEYRERIPDYRVPMAIQQSSKACLISIENAR